jgi:hypothetical protein
MSGMSMNSYQNNVFQQEVVDKIKSNTLCSITFFSRKSRPLWDNVDKYDTDWQATDDNIVRRIHFEYGIPKTHT